MILAGDGGRRTELVSRFAIRSMGMKNRKKNSDRIRNPFVARPCEVVVSGDATCYYCRYSRGWREETHDNAVVPGETGKVNGLGDE